MNKKKVLISFSLVSLFLILIFSNSILSKAAQDDDDLEVTLHCRLESDSVEIQSTLISSGTYNFFEGPQLDTGEFSHDVSQIEVKRLQTQDFNYTDSEHYSFISGVNATQGNHSIEFPHEIQEYTIAKELDTVISLNMNYSAINYSIISNFEDDLDSDEWDLYDEYDNPISLIEGNYNATYSFDNQSWHSNFNRGIEGSSTVEYNPLIDGHLTCIEIDDKESSSSSDFNIDLQNSLESGTIEIWVRITDASKRGYFALHDETYPFSKGGYFDGARIPLCIVENEMRYYTTSWHVVKTNIQSNTWYHWRIDFECGSGGYKGLSADTFDWYVDEELVASDANFYQVASDIKNVQVDTEDSLSGYQFQFDGLGITGQEDDYQIGENTDHCGVSYMRTGGTKDLSLYNEKASQDIKITEGDTLEIEGYINTTESFNVKFLNDDSIVHQQEVINNDNTDFVNLSITDTFSFDQLLFQGIFEEDRYFILETLNIRGYSNSPLFTNIHVTNFTYQILGVNYTESFALTLDQNLDHSTPNGSYRYYFDSSMFSQFDRANDLTILSQELNITFDLSSTTAFFFTMNISCSSSNWILPTQVDLGINSNDVIDTSLNSGVVYLSSFPETLEIISDVSNVVFELNISISFTLTFDLEIITKTYLRKSFTLLSDHSIIIERIDLPNGLDLKKVYFNDNSIGTDDPNDITDTTMNEGNIFSLEVILDDEIYERLPYVSNMGTDSFETIYNEKFTYLTSEMSHSYHPDSQNQTYTFENGYVEMKNSLPNDYKTEDWSDWNIQSNENYINSTESNGNFSSRLNTYSSSDVPTQPDDFTFVNGSFNDTSHGDLEEINGNYTRINSSGLGLSGHFPATYSFEDDTIGGDPQGWTIDETGGTIEVVENLDGHGMIVEFNDTSTSDAVRMQNDITETATGTVECWMRVNSSGGKGYFIIGDGDDEISAYLYMQNDGNFMYYDGSGHVIMGYEIGRWYHVRIEFDCATDWHLWIDNVSMDGGAGYSFWGSPSAMDRVVFKTYTLIQGVYYVDAIGYSWEPGYTIGDNVNESSGGTMNFNITFDFDPSLINANETLDHVELRYSCNSSIMNLQLNMSIWNFDLNRFDALNYSQLDGNFYNSIFILNSSFYNASYHVILNFNASSVMFFQLNLEMLIIEFNWTKTSGLIYSNFSQFFTHSFLNRYDSHSAYQDLYNISVNFRYRLSNYTSYLYQANISINDNNSINALNIDGNWHEFSHDFTFNSSSMSGFWITLNLTNGLLEIIDMNYSIIFNCLDINDKTRLSQYFSIDPSFSLDQYEKTGKLYINFTHSFIEGDKSFNYANSSLLIIKFIIETEDGNIIRSYNYNNSFSSSLFSLNIRELLNNNSKEEFRDFSIEIWLSGDESEYHLDNLYLLNKLEKIQLTDNPRTDTDSVEFRDFLVASRDFSYWYFSNINEINDVDMLNKRTDSLTESFDEENNRYYFVDSAQEDDIYQSDIDYDPNWDVSYSFTSDGTSTDLTITYSADMSIDNVTIVLDLSDDDLYMENWTNGATQDEDTFILELPRMNFTSTEQSITIEGISDIPNARFRRFECQEIPFIDGTAKTYEYKAYIKYTRYSRAYILRGVEDDWEIDGIHYESNIMTLQSNNYFETKPNAFDSSITGSYLKFNADPINNFSVHDYQNGTLYIKIDCNLPIENASVMFALPSELRYQITSDLQYLTSLGEIFDYDYYYFYTSDLEIGVNKIYIEYEIHSLNDDLLLFIPLVLLTIAVFGLWYYMKNKEINQKLAEMTEREKRAYYRKMQEEGGMLTKAWRSIQDMFRKKTPQEKALKKRERELKERRKKEQKKRILI